ncbi:uncharacterized protein K452DRAFT_312771 [Aplosporella prunicola CBS 121167]|uniref:Rhodopsin domain-containing protein n=1 Tax=Aplosporella prunicola CBS 121167 TaxID=1176127 RepID=A0A6A6B1S7_9PEZI|nr:uncharacterized protein K452DRAFT_312771 [Aplosporella prunicola CBS 121167]KAF2136967.1 hypothetical protein K452DRAFT_312771 [Aplosporella prunicola CBS 121167]
MAIYLDDAPKVAGVIITLTILGFLTFGLRVYTRITKATWGPDDWCMAFAMLPFTVLSISCLVASFMGVGVHIENLKKPENVKYQVLGMKWFFFFEVFYCVTVIPIKLSIAFTIIRIAAGRKLFVYSQYVVCAMFTIMNLIAALYIIFRCSPVSAAWTMKGKCDAAIILTDIYYATTAVNIVTDWFTAAMPIPLLWNVKLNRNAKISVAGILGLGIFASLSACIRLKYTVNLTNTNDNLFAVANIVIWGYAENGVGLIVGCISTLRPLFRKLLHLGGSDSDTSTPSKGLTAHSGWPSNGRRTYKECESAYELQNSAEDSKFGSTAIETRIRGAGAGAPGLTGGRESLSEDGSMKNILLGDQQQDQNGIMVSHNVQITHD